MPTLRHVYRPILVALCALVAAGLYYHRRPSTPVADPHPLTQPPPTQQEPPREDSGFHFTTMTGQCGIDFRYYGNPSSQHYMTEQNGGGVALFDCDGDGRLDVFLVNGSHFEKPAQQAGATNRLYQQRDDWQFEDVTLPAGLEAYGFGMGCAAADYDNDGFSDLFVAYYGRNRLWHNNGDGTLQEVTTEAGVGDDRWGTSAAFADLDGDGNLDLFVCNYVDWPSNEPPCYTIGPNPLPIPCSPVHYSAQPDLLYRNLGQGDFVEIGAEAGVAIPEKGKGLAVAIADLDQDGLLDVYVANDQTLNFLFRNLGGMRFAEEGVVKGVAFSDGGKLGAGMGIGCADYNRDGRFDLCVSNFRNQVNDVFLNLGESGFIATNAELGIDDLSHSVLSFAILFQDFNLDGWPDMFVANGHIWDLRPSGRQYPYKMLPQLLRNDRGKRFAAVAAGEYFAQRRLGRAAAYGDLDNDGDADLVVTHMENPAAVLQNDGQRAGRSLRLRLIGVRSARQPLGVRVDVRCADEWLVTQVPAGGSFQASHDPRVIVPVLGNATVDEVRVHWSPSYVESWQNLPTGELATLVEGTGHHQDDSGG